jgi:hypothetical protein
MVAPIFPTVYQAIGMLSVEPADSLMVYGAGPTMMEVLTQLVAFGAHKLRRFGQAAIVSNVSKEVFQ